MTGDKVSILQAIDETELTLIMRQALRSDNAQLVDWRVTQLGGGAGNPVSAGLYRVAGSATDQNQRLDWSVVLKTIQSPANVGWENMGEGDDPTHWNYWRRELLVYRSDLLTALPAGMAAPRCYQSVELPGNVVWLWLEDIVEDPKGAWDLDRYALTARHLGRLNGMYIAGQPLPEYSWLSRQRTRQWIGMGPLWQSIPWDHPLVRGRYPGSAANSFRRLLHDNEIFLARLGNLPTTLCHGDTYPTNFKVRRAPSGEDQTVALDWALVGIETVGDDLGQLVFGAQTDLAGVDPVKVDRTLFESYINGLLDSGYRPDPRLVRFGFVTSAAVRVGLFQLVLLDDALRQSDRNMVVDTDRPGVAKCFEITMADEAYELLDVINS